MPEGVNSTRRSVQKHILFNEYVGMNTENNNVVQPKYMYSNSVSPLPTTNRSYRGELQTMRSDAVVSQRTEMMLSNRLIDFTGRNSKSPFKEEQHRNLIGNRALALTSPKSIILEQSMEKSQLVESVRTRTPEKRLIDYRLVQRNENLMPSKYPVIQK